MNLILPQNKELLMLQKSRFSYKDLKSILNFKILVIL